MSTARTDLPPPDTDLHDTGPDTEDRSRARRQVALMEEFGFTPSSRLLEIGCGVGRLAYELSGYLGPEGRYVGFDLSDVAIAWLNDRYAPHLPNFRFDRFDVANGRYRPAEGTRAETVTFPYADGEFDFACSFAVFMHMTLAEITNYLRELHRVLDVGATAVLTAVAITAEDHDREELPTLGARRFQQVGDGVYAKRPNDLSYGMGYHQHLLGAVMEQVGFSVTRFLVGSWRRTGAFSLLPNVGGDVFVLSRPGPGHPAAGVRLVEDAAAAPDRSASDQVASAVVDDLAGGRIDEALDRLLSVPGDDWRTRHQQVRLRARHAGIPRLRPAPVAHPVPDPEPGTAGAAGAVPEVDGAPPDAGGAVAEAMQTPGCVVLRGVLDTGAVASVATAVDEALKALFTPGRRPEDVSGDFWPGLSDHPVDELGRVVAVHQGTLWLAEAPRAGMRLLAELDRAGLRDLVAAVLGCRPALSVARSTVSRLGPEPATGWWQEWRPAGTHVLGLWVCLSGPDAPAADLEVVPRRLPVLGLHDDPAGPLGIDPDELACVAGEVRPVRLGLGPGDVAVLHPSVARRTPPGLADAFGHLASLLAVHPDRAPTREGLMTW